MKQTEERAIGSFRSGLNCAQAVLTAYSEDLSFDINLAMSISCGFGGGMGRLQETCGAATGAFMVLGIWNCKKHSDNKIRKEETYRMIQQFSDRFKSQFGTLNCKSLLKCDLKTEEGQQYLKEHNLVEDVCEKCIIGSIRIIEGLIAK